MTGEQLDQLCINIHKGEIYYGLRTVEIVFY